MFSENKKSKIGMATTSQQNTIAQGTTIVGDIVSEGGFRIDGILKGTLKTPGKVVVGKSGVIQGTLEGVNADFEGKFSGKLLLSETLSLKSSAHIEGEVQIGKLAVEPGATFNAVCSMKGAIKELVNDNQKNQQAKTEEGKSA